MPNEQALFSQAVALHRQGKLTEAQGLYRRVLALAPSHADALHRLGASYLQQNDAKQAAELIGRALALNPDLAEAYANMGGALMALRRPAEAAAHFRRALKHMPDSPRLHASLGLVLQAQNRHAEAADAYEQALALDPGPGRAEVRMNLALALHSLNRHEQALALLEDVVAGDPGNAEALVNLGVVLHTMNRDGEALARHDAALRLKPGNPAALYGQALSHLRAGDLAKGWTLWENRWGHFPARALADAPYPLWRGDRPLGGKKLLVQFEFTLGMGDCLQLVRYVPLLQRRGAEVWVQAPKVLRSLLQRSLPGAHVVAQEETPAGLDLRVLFFSLPLAMVTLSEPSIPRDAPYLVPDPDRVGHWQRSLPQTKAPRVGVLWRAGKGGIERSVQPAGLAPLFAVAGIQFVNLQMGLAPGELQFLKTQPNVLPLDSELGDFDETAALMQALDLVITVDTAAAHLAGGLAKPAWVMLGFSPEWRWMLERGDSPWYPAMRLFRPRAARDWAWLVRQVAVALHEFAAQRRV